MDAVLELTQAEAELLELRAAEARREFLDALQGAPLVCEAYNRWQAAERQAFEGRRARREAEAFGP
jgi:hypothetical protein